MNRDIWHADVGPPPARGTCLRCGQVSGSHQFCRDCLDAWTRARIACVRPPNPMPSACTWRDNLVIALTAAVAAAIIYGGIYALLWLDAGRSLVR